ncbi:hypothetical protein FRC02_011483 [Tulasnella sp. 418]|nr:hypothetical protein FRC02_011483 [Tulasnella sp. 418]
MELVLFYMENEVPRFTASFPQYNSPSNDPTTTTKDRRRSRSLGLEFRLTLTRFPYIRISAKHQAGMGLLSSSEASNSSSSLASAGVATLNGAQVSLTLLKEVVDGTNVPFVKGVAGLAVEVIKIAKAIQSNKDECDNLMKRTTSLLVVILGSFRGKTQEAIPDHLKNGVERLTTSFHEILAELRIIEKRAGKGGVRGLARAILYHIDNGDKLKECSGKLEWAMGEFQVTSNIDSCLKDLERHEEILKGQESIKKEVREGQARVEENMEANHAEIRDGLTEIRDVITGQSTTKSSSAVNLPSTVMPAEPKIFGRQEYVEKAVTLLRSGATARLVILGPGGMGKTSVALKIVYDGRVKERYGQYRCWIPCEQATSIPLFVELLAKSLNLPPSSSSDRFSEVIIFLENSETVYLLLLDNFETPWDIEGQQSNVAEILTKLASVPSVSIIITMRGAQYPSSNTIEWSTPRLPSLTQLDLDSAEEAFLKISPDAAGDTELKILLQKLDCMPLAITLMAKLSEAGETIQELLSQWSTERTRLLDQPGGDRRNSIEVSIKLSLESRAVRGNPDALRLLSVLARLPAGAALDRLQNMCPSIPNWKAALRVLRGAALVYDSADKSRVQVLSPIQSYIMLHHPLEQGALEELRTAYYQLAPPEKIRIDHPEFTQVSKVLAKEEVNIEAILIDALHDANGDREKAIEASVCYTGHAYYAHPRPEVIIEAVRIAKETGSSSLAHCLRLHGAILRAQGNDDLAEPILEEAKEEFTKMEDQEYVARMQWFLGAIYARRGDYERAHTALQAARDALLKVGCTVEAAYCLWEIAQGFYLQEKWSSACSVVEQARSEFIGLENRLGVAKCALIRGAALGREGRLDESQSDLEEAWSALLEMGDFSSAAGCLWHLGDAHLMAGNYSVALAKYEEALASFTQQGIIYWIEVCNSRINEVHTILANQ